MKRFLALIFLLVFSQNLFAQLETAVWYFGDYAGLDFKTPEQPKILLDGALQNWEGVASFSDSLGNILFYTDGRTIWNREHKIMQNGDDLIGHPSSTESAIIVPFPEHTNKYFVFVVDAYRGSNGLSYSIVDMSLNDGLGAVTDVKNVMLENRVGEKVTAIRHANNKDFWLLSRLDPGNELVEYKITKDGIDLSSRKTFAISILELPELQTGDDAIHNDLALAIGYMRVSPNGQKIACAIQGGSLQDEDRNFINVLEVFNFDPSNGQISKYFTYLDKVAYIYGVEFSNDVSKLYFTSRRSIFQFDLSAGDADDVKNSVTKIGEYPIYPKNSDLDTNYAGALQLALNGKIYVAQDNYPYLGVIENPRESGSDCNYVTDGQYLGGRLSRMGLPNFIPTYFLPPNFEITRNCTNDTTFFHCIDTRNISKYQWVLSYSDGNKIASSDEKDFMFPISKSGTYKISLTITVNGIEHSEYRFFEVFDAPDFKLQNDTLICENDTAIINSVVPGDCEFSWTFSDSDLSSSDSVLYISNNNKIYETVKNIFTGCKFKDSVSVTVAKPYEFSLGTDSSFCVGDSLTLEFHLEVDNFKSFVWLDDSSQTLTRTFSKPDDYILKSQDKNLCFYQDTIRIAENQLPKINFSTDSIFCNNLENYLDCKVENVKYFWNNGDTTQIIKVENPGVYSVKVVDSNNCQSTDSVELKLKTLPEIYLPNDTCFCEDSVLTLEVFWPDATDYLWDGFQNSEAFEISVPGIYTVKTTNICGSVTDTVSVTSKYCGEILIPNIITPNGDDLNDYFRIKGLDSGWHLEIFTREGVRVFVSDNYQNDWSADGLSDGVYFYLLEKSSRRYKGNVTVFHQK